MSNATSTGGNGIGCGTVLAMIFITLKLTGHIDWSWWWVLSPLWAPVILVLIFVLGYAAIATVVERRRA